MAISFPFEFVDLGVPVPFVILPNPDFPGETKPLCILREPGGASGSGHFYHDGRPPLSERSGPLVPDFPLGDGWGPNCGRMAA
jgi:hypothetical protein